MKIKELYLKITLFCQLAGRYISNDGFCHIIVSALLMLAFGWMRPLWAPIAIVALIGAGKEIYDHYRKGTHDHLHDFVCDGIGILVGLLLALLNSL